MSEVIDFHNHAIPGVDDGAKDDGEAVAALAAFREQGILRIIATPHVQGSVTRSPADLEARLAEIDRGWSRLEAIACTRFGDMVVERGAEIALDAPDPDLSDARLRLAGGAFALVEYPYMSVPPQSTRAIEWLVRDGVRPVIAHPERYRGVTPDCVRPRAWRAAGALLQINAGSLTGRYGPAARDNVFALLEHGLADFLCSDFHARGAPLTRSACRVLTELGAVEQLQLLTDVNPRLMLDGGEPLPVPPLRVRRGVVDRMRRWFG